MLGPFALPFYEYIYGIVKTKQTPIIVSKENNFILSFIKFILVLVDNKERADIVSRDFFCSIFKC
jgi:hypothetical protein